ncbi:MAG: CinA family protein [Stellaceae bacterium]
MIESILAKAEDVAARLRARHETVAVVESSTGGLIAAALLSVPGASDYFVAGGVIYTGAVRRALLQIDDAAMVGMRAASAPYALLCAHTVRARCATVWGIGESGAAGPTGNRYGDAAGHSAIAVAGPVERSLTLETNSTDRRANMVRFADAALDLLIECLA